jgi:protein ImuB
MACGEQEHLLVPAEPVFTLEEHLAFDAPVDNLESLLFALSPLLEQLISRARNRALLLASVTVRLHLERAADSTDQDRHSERELPADDPIHERTLKPALPLDDRALLLKLLQLDLQAHPAPAAVVAITLHADPGPRPGVQTGLFLPQTPEPMRLEVTLARLAALVGEDRVGRAVLTDKHQSQSFQVERFTVTEPETGGKRLRRRPDAPDKSVQAASGLRTGICLRRLRPAPLVHVTWNAGKLQSFRLPDSVSMQPRYKVSRAFGPWQRSGQWWSGEAWSQEEWDVDAEAADGSRLLALLVHDLLRLQWQLEATYD